MNRLRHSKLPAVLVAAAALTAASVLTVPAQGARTRPPGPGTAQAGCLLKSLSLRTSHAQAGRIMVFRSSIQCLGNTPWTVTMLFRRRRFGPDKSVAYKQFKGSGSKRFVVGADCKQGQRFNGNFRIDFAGPGQGGSRVVKNKKCD